MKSLWTGLGILLLLANFACQARPDLDALRVEVQELHESFIRAHLAKDAVYLASSISPDYLSVSAGDVRPETPEDMEATLTAYLSQAEFSHYEDTAPPIIGFSEDGTLAWVIAQVRVAGMLDGGAEDRRHFDTQWAWLSVFRNSEDGWIRLTDVSTNRPFDSTGQP